MKRKNERIWNYAWTAPVVLIIVALLAYPIFRTIQLSFYEYNLTEVTQTFIGLEGYWKALSSEDFYSFLYISVVWTFGTVISCLVIALPMAAILNNEFRFKWIMRSILMLPWATPWVIIALTWKWMFSSNFGMIDYLLRAVGLGVLIRNWLGDPDVALFSVMVPTIWRGYTFGAFMYLAAMQTVPLHLYEAAEIDGAGPIKKFFHVTLPGILPTVVVVNLLGVMWTLNAIQMIWIMTQGGPLNSTTTLPVAVYKTAFLFHRFGEASVYGVFIGLMLLIFALLYVQFIAKKGELAEV
jgi:multiple sugar transport system permease protein